MSAEPTLVVEIAPGDNWNEASKTWVAITADVLRPDQINIESGRTSQLDSIRPSRLTLTLRDPDRDYDPENSAGSYAGDLKPLMPIRVRATHNSLTYDKFTGHVIEWTRVEIDQKVARVQVQALDALTVAALRVLRSRWVDEVEALSPTHWWRLGEASGTTAIDKTGGVHGTYQGGPTLGVANSGIKGDPDTGITVDGASNHVEIPASGSIDSSGAWTLILWLKTAVAGSLTTPYVLFSQRFGKNDGVHLELEDFARIEWLGTGNMNGTNDLNDGAWHMIVVTHDGSGNYELFEDGSSVDTTAQGSPVEFPSHRILLGTDAEGGFGGTTQDFVGELDEPLVWNGTQLSAAQISDLYDAANDPWGSQLTSARITAVLDEAGWPAALRDLDTGLTTLEEWTDAGQSALEGLFTAVNSENGFMFVAGDGDLTFVNRQDRSHNVYAETFDRANGIRFYDISLSRPDINLRTAVDIATKSGDLTRVIDGPTESTYGRRTVSRTTHTTDPEEPFDYANWLVGEHSQLKSDITLVLKFGAPASNAEWAALLARELNDLVRVIHSPVGGGADVDIDAFIEHMSLQIRPGIWQLTMQLSNADGQRMFVLDDTDLGVLDGTKGVLGW